MALNNTSRFICRSCRDGFQQQQTLLSRHFSTTRSLRKGSIPKFSPSSSPELDSLLAAIRSKVFVPAYLNQQQLKLVRSNKMKTQLENDPVYTTIGDEEIRLEHIDVTQDQPPAKVFLEVLDLAKAPQDWDNIPALLEGWHHARPKMKDLWYGKLIQKANKAAMMPVVIQCLWQVERNGFTLANPIVRERILLEIRSNAQRVGLEKSLKQIQTILELMEKPEHCGSRTVSETDPRAEPYVIAVPLELAALQAKAQFGGKDENGTVSIYFNRLITALGQQKLELTQSELWSSTEGGIGRYRSLNRLCQKHIPVRNGLQFALEILGASLTEESSRAGKKYRKLVEERLDLATSTARKLVAANPEIPNIEIQDIEEWEQSRVN